MVVFFRLTLLVDAELNTDKWPRIMVKCDEKFPCKNKNTIKISISVIVKSPPFQNKGKYLNNYSACFNG